MEKIEKVLVTGGGGYIGRHVVDVLAGRGVKVLVADPKYISQSESITTITEDIFSDGKALYEKYTPDVVIHLAWRDGFKHNSDAHIDNLAGHYRFVKGMLEGGLGHLVTMGTVHEIGYYEGAINESTPTNPRSPYGVAKNAMRQLTEFLTSQDDKVIFQHIRAFYITGDDTKSQSVFGKILEADARGDKEFPFVTGEKKYDFIDVKELAKQIVAVAHQSKVRGIINCCTGQPVSLAERAEQFIKEHDLTIRLKYGVFPDRPYESPSIYGDATKIKEILSQ